MLIENERVAELFSDLAGWQNLVLFSPEGEIVQVASSAAPPTDAFLHDLLQVADRVRVSASKTGMGTLAAMTLEGAVGKVLFQEKPDAGFAIALVGRSEMNIALSRIKLIDLVRALEAA